MFAIVGFLSPQVMAGFGVRTGNHNMTASAYHRIYRRNPTYQNLYLSINRMIHAERHRQIVYYSPRLFGSEEYDEIIRAVNATLSKNAPVHPVLYSAVVNEHDRLRSAYVRSLITRGYFERAIEVYWEESDNFFEIKDTVFSYFAAPPMSTIPAEPKAVMLHLLSRPSRVMLEIWDHYHTNLSFRIFMDAAPGGLSHLTQIGNDFLYAYVPAFIALRERVRIAGGTEEQLRVANGYITFLQQLDWI